MVSSTLFSIFIISRAGWVGNTKKRCQKQQWSSSNSGGERVSSGSSSNSGKRAIKVFQRWTNAVNRSSRDNEGCEELKMRNCGLQLLE
jgi:hypothetical protein